MEFVDRRAVSRGRPRQYARLARVTLLPALLDSHSRIMPASPIRILSPMSRIVEKLEMSAPPAIKMEWDLFALQEYASHRRVMQDMPSSESHTLS